MKALPLAALALLLCTAAQAQVSPQTLQFLQTAGIDPNSPEAAAAIAEGVIYTTYEGDAAEFSLEMLAAQKRKNGVLAFIHTRAFIAKLKENFAGTSIPKDNYDPLYLTEDERALVGRKFAERFKKK
jgi:hypothetical protein